MSLPASEMIERPRSKDRYPLDETTELLGRKDEIQERKWKKLGWRFWLMMIFLYIIIYGFIVPALGHASWNWWKRTFHKTGNVFDIEFEQITPSEKLEWHPCREGMFCARLTVPMDYNRPLNASADNPKVHLALVLGPGKHPFPGAFSTSPLLINPGGPGGSGTQFATILSRQLQWIVDPQQDIIGFDPRGVGATTPRLDCFSPAYQETVGSPYDFGAVDAQEGLWKRGIWLTSSREIGLINSTSASLSKLDRRARLLGQLCQEKDAVHGKNSIFRHLGTPNVARDMISIIDAWDEWRDSIPAQYPSIKKVTDKERSKYPLDTKGKLVYWGYSYGTLLGATFAALFPDRVGRLVLDGVVDADQYVSPVWGESIVDSDTIFNSFPKYCYEGQTKCKLYRPGDSLADLEDRFYNTQSKLKARPLSFISSTYTPVTFTYDDFRAVAFSTLYSPTYFGFYLIGYLLDALVRGDHSVIESIIINTPRDIFCNRLPESLYPTDAQISIICGDKRYPLNETIPNLEKRFEEMSNISSFADVWLSVMMGCDGWGIEQIDPPLKWGKHPAHKERPINTSFPILFLSNTYDPVTPFRDGLKMAQRFVNSGFIEQKSMGHCSLAAVSLCTLKKVKEYFLDGKVPSHPIPGKKYREGDWERCEPNEWPFKEMGEAPIGELSEHQTTDENIVQAAKKIQEVLREFHDPDRNRVLKVVEPRNSQCSTAKACRAMKETPGTN